MKNQVLSAVVIAFLTTTSFAEVLDGRTYCREVKGGFGVPSSVASKHCVSFSKGRMSDNSETFFGNPPTEILYRVEIEVVINNETSEETAYSFRGYDLIYNGEVMKEIGPFDHVIAF